MSSREERCLVLYFHRNGGETLHAAYKMPLGQSFVRAFLAERGAVRERAVEAIQYALGEKHKVQLWVLAVGDWWNPEEHSAVSPQFLDDPRVRVITPEELVGSERFDHVRRDGRCFALHA